MNTELNYLLFAGDRYYPNGGVNDYRGEFISIDAAHEWLDKNNECDFAWWHIALRVDMSICDSKYS